jgi:hypothetical protein
MTVYNVVCKYIGKNQVTFDLKGVDAGTNKNIASAGGTGNPVMGAILPVVFGTAVLSHR